jgi:hypothetical protein
MMKHYVHFGKLKMNRYATLKKKDGILNQRGFHGLKNSFVHSTKPEKAFDF